MRIARFIPLVVLPLLFSCAAHKTEVPLAEAPAEPLIRALNDHRQSFRSLKAVAAVQVSRKGRRRSFDSVGVLVRAEDRFKLEAYGPLGQPMYVLLWNGSEVLHRSLFEPVQRSPKAALAQLLGADVEPQELCAVLSGNIPDIAGYDAKAFCGAGVCALELRKGDTLRRLRVSSPPAGDGSAVQLLSSELYRGTTLLYRADYEAHEVHDGYLLPRRITVSNPERSTALAVEYQDVEVNTAVGDAAFTLDRAGGTDR